MGDTVQVHGRYRDGARAATGTVAFTPNTTWYDTRLDEVIEQSPTLARLVHGEFYLDLLATDLVGITPAAPDRWWHVAEDVTGSTRSFDLLLPHAVAAIDLSDYEPVDLGDGPEFVSLRLENLTDVDLTGVPYVDGKYLLAGEVLTPYEHVQVVAQTTWTIDHPLSRDPIAIQVFDESGQQYEEWTTQFTVPGQQVRLGYDIAIAGRARMI
jgi:hypothetical protein